MQNASETTTQEPKLQWNQPKLVELDVNSTESGAFPYVAESLYSHTSS